jgi:DNA-directed RNA polymerase specialized sigma24 family protein
LGIETGAVKSRLHRARARLRRILTPYFRGSNAR